MLNRTVMLSLRDIGPPMRIGRCGNRFVFGASRDEGTSGAAAIPGLRDIERVPLDHQEPGLRTRLGWSPTS